MHRFRIWKYLSHFWNNTTRLHWWEKGNFLKFYFQYYIESSKKICKYKVVPRCLISWSVFHLIRKKLYILILKWDFETRKVELSEMRQSLWICILCMPWPERPSNTHGVLRRPSKYVGTRRRTKPAAAIRRRHHDEFGHEKSLWCSQPSSLLSYSGSEMSSAIAERNKNLDP